MIGKWIAMVCGIVGLATLSFAATDISAILDILKKSGLPEDVWYPKSTVSADFTCDGNPDILIRGKRGQTAIDDVDGLPSTASSAKTWSPERHKEGDRP